MVAAIASVFIGYRVVAMFGSLLVLAGFLSASFVNPGDNIELMGFLVGFLGGMFIIRLAPFMKLSEFSYSHIYYNEYEYILF